MSNLVHRRRRCARIDIDSILLPGGQYARGLVVNYHYPRALPPVTQSSALQAPECLWDSFFYHGFNGLDG